MEIPNSISDYSRARAAELGSVSSRYIRLSARFPMLSLRWPGQQAIRRSGTRDHGRCEALAGSQNGSVIAECGTGEKFYKTL
jgi:hypothetical protein